MKQRNEILVVDDDRDSCEAFAAALRQSGYAVDAAPNGFEALARLGRRPVDLVITDLRMPGMSGLELIRRIHAIDPATRVLLVTGVGDTRDLCTGAEGYGAVDCLVKPINLDELLWSIDCALVCDRPAEAGAAPARGVQEARS
jgi:DNA-binding response OmpR family regulator